MQAHGIKAHWFKHMQIPASYLSSKTLPVQRDFTSVLTLTQLEVRVVKLILILSKFTQSVSLVVSLAATSQVVSLFWWDPWLHGIYDCTTSDWLPRTKILTKIGRLPA